MALVWWLCATLWLDSLALVQEFKARDRQFLRAIGQHVTLVGAAVSISVVVGLVLAMLMRRYARLQKGAFVVLNFLQTIPSLALFGLLLACRKRTIARPAWRQRDRYDACLDRTDCL